MSESARGEGGRVWVPRTVGDKRPIKQIPESERFYFLEEWYPKYGNLVPRDIATRAIHKVVYEHHLGIDGQPMVYLDLTHIDRETLNRKLEGILEIYEKFVGDDPREVPMKIFPGMHYTMGGLWVDFNQMTNIPGIFAAGECEYQYHGANRLGANSLVSCIFGGFRAGPNALAYAKKPARNRRRRRPCGRTHAPGRDQQQTHQQRRHRKSLQALARTRRNHDQARHRHPLQQGTRRSRQEDRRAAWIATRRSTSATRASGPTPASPSPASLNNMLELSRVVVQGAILRDESRGAHYKPDFPDRNDEKFLKTTKASFTGQIDGPRFEFEDVDIQYIKPRPRRYDAAK